jgi:hypothetical protein
MFKTAHLVRDLPTPWYGAAQKLYRLSDVELSSTGYVVVSALMVPGSGPETSILPATPAGDLLDMVGLDGSIQGSMSHCYALETAGYQVVPGELLFSAEEAEKKPEAVPVLEPGFVMDPEPEE